MTLQRVPRLARAATALFTLAVFGAPASAQSTWQAFLSSAQEVGPPNGSIGNGYAFMSLTGNMLSIHIEFSGLTGLTTASHIHCCAGPGVNAAVATQTPSFIGFPLGVTSGTFDNIYDLTLSTSYRAGFITDNGGTTASAMAVLINGMNTGNAYVNIHTQSAPGGEIRGQIVATPEPSTVVLLTAGLVGVMVAARRRRA